MEMKRIFITLLVLQLLVVASFSYFAHQADLAMSKDGIGDLAKFNSFNRYAGISFYSASTLWVVGIVMSLAKRQFRCKEAQLAICVPPFAMIFGVLFLWLV